MQALRRRERTTRELLARAALYRWLAGGFAYPEEGHLRALARDYERLDRDLLREILPPALRTGLVRAQRAWGAWSETALAAEYTRLFLAGTPVALHETAYGDARHLAGRSAELADVSGFYHAFGLQLSGCEVQRPDHVSVELEFLSLLLLKEAYAYARGRMEPYRIARDAAAAFLRDHLGCWLAALRQTLSEHAGATPYAAMAELAEAAVAHECRRHRVQPLRREGMAYDLMQAETFTCPRESVA